MSYITMQRAAHFLMIMGVILFIFSVYLGFYFKKHPLKYEKETNNHNMKSLNELLSKNDDSGEEVTELLDDGKLENIDKTDKL